MRSSIDGVGLPEHNEYKTIDVVIEELGSTNYKVRQAIAVLDISPMTFNFDKRGKYYSPEDVQRIREWLFGE